MRSSIPTPSDREIPSPSLLDASYSQILDNQLPLHVKVNRCLRYVIENNFAHGQRFYTEQEIIKHLKVSQMTVRRAIYDLVRDGVLERLVAKGSFVNKRPKATNLTGQIAIHLEEWDSAFIHRILQKTLAACNERNLNTKVFYSTQQSSILNREGVAWSQSEIRAALFLALPPSRIESLAPAYLQAGKPVVCVDGLSSNVTTHFVGTDNVAVNALGLDHLTTLGHRRICLLVNEPEESYAAQIRIRAFEAERQKRGLTEAFIYKCHTQFWEDSYKKAYNLFGEVWDQRPTAVFTLADPGAWAVLKWCSRHGIKIPQELSVLGFADDRPSAYTHPALSSIAHPMELLIDNALDLLFNNPSQSQTRLFEPRLVVRESSSAPSTTFIAKA